MEYEISRTQLHYVDRVMFDRQKAKLHKLKRIKLHLNSKCPTAAHRIRVLGKPIYGPI